MKKFILVLFLTATVNAQFVSDEAKNNEVISIAALKELPDDSHAVLEGYILERVQHSDDDYIFKSGSDTIRIEINDEVFRGQKVTPNTKIRIRGEVDHKHHKNEVEFEVDYLEVI